MVVPCTDPIGLRYWSRRDPSDQAAGTRRTLYNLYHVLNHLNLFGGGYLAQAEDMIARLLSELGA